MSSFPRRWQRKLKRQAADYEPKSRPFKMHDDGIGYDVLRPTKGWLRVSAKRLQHFGARS